MALAEQHRAKLDAIVGRMSADGQPPEAIKAVVEDFKVKYTAPRTTAQTLTDPYVGLAKSAGSTLSGMGRLATAVNPAVRMLPQNMQEQLGRQFDKTDAAMVPEGRAQEVAKTVGNVAQVVGLPSTRARTIGGAVASGSRAAGPVLMAGIKAGASRGFNAVVEGKGISGGLATGLKHGTKAAVLEFRARLAHALGRAVKAEPAIAGKVAPLVEKVAPAASQAAGGGISSAAAELGRRGGMASGVARKAASEARKGAEAARKALTPAQAGANAIEQKIVEAHAQGMSPGQIRDTLRQQFGIKDSVGAQMIGMVQQAYGLKPHVMR